MNKSFKVVFNKARGALMVVNEVTSSVQAKGTKTVIAAAVATMVAGGAVAAETQWVEAPKDAVAQKPADNTFTAKDYLYKYENDSINNNTDQFISANQSLKFDKNLWIVSEDTDTSVNGIWASGDKVIAENAGHIYVTGNNSYKTKAMGAAAGATVINSGTIVAKNAYGMIVGSGDNGEPKQAKIINAETGKIIVEGQGAAIELGGKDLTGTAINNGVIDVVGNFDKDAAENSKWAHGVLINTATNTFENNGVINATAKGTAAIVVTENAQVTNLQFGEKSDVNGLIYLGKGTTNIEFAGTKDDLTIKTAENSTTHLNILNGADITLADKMGSKYETANINNGKLTASIWQDDNQFKDVTVGAEGVFNITKLNFGGSADQTANDAKPHSKLLLAFGSHYKLDGGKLQVAGTDYQGDLQIGASTSGNKGTGKLTISDGAYTFKNLKIGNASENVVTIEGGQLTVGDLHISGKSHGKLALTGGVTKVNGNFTTAQQSIELNGGTLVTKGANIFKTEQKASEYVTTGAVNAHSGIVELTDTNFEYSLADLKKGQALLNSNNAVQLILNGTLKLAENEKLDANSVSGLNLAQQTGVTGESATDAFNVDKKTTIGAIDFAAIKDKDAQTVTLGNTAELTLVGNGTDVFKNLSAKVTKVEAGDLVLGTQDSKSTIGVDTLAANNLTVVGDFAAKNIEVNNAYVDGALALNSLKVAENGKAHIEDGSLYLLGVTAKDAKEITGKVIVTGAGLLTTNKAAADAYIPLIEDEKTPAVLYVDRIVKLADGAQVQIGGQVTTKAAANPQAPAANNASITVENGGYALVDASKFVGSKDAVFGENTDVAVNNGGELDLINVNKTGEVKLGASVTVGQNGELDTDSLYLNAKAGDKGVVAINYRDGVLGDKTVDARLKDLFKKGASAKEMTILNGLDKDVYLDTKTDTFNALGNKAFEQATGGNATAGVFNVAYDANAQVTDAIVRHQLAEKTYMGAWADVFYAKNEAKEMYGNSGYSADIYGGVLGFDATFSCGATGGVAIAMGKADAESEGGVFANKLDSDFWGVSVYTAKDFDGLNVKADLGYMDFSNDFSGLGDASDASTITFGVRGDYTAYQNGAFSVAPHFGLRYTHIDTDAVAFNDAQTMNVFEAPIGVKFAGTFETTGWKVVPSYDFTIVPQFGDKEVEAFGTAGDVTILNGGLVNNVIGVEASKGNLSFGLNGVYGVGAHDRANTQINANVRYNF